jgi:hypothetical protein
MAVVTCLQPQGPQSSRAPPLSYTLSAISCTPQRWSLASLIHLHFCILSTFAFQGILKVHKFPLLYLNAEGPICPGLLFSCLFIQCRHAWSIDTSNVWISWDVTELWERSFQGMFCPTRHAGLEGLMGFMHVSGYGTLLSTQWHTFCFAMFIC